MASEIRVNKINSSTGVGTITLSPTGVDISGITTVSTLKVGTGLTASEDGDVFFTGVCTATTFSGAHSGSGANLTALPAGNLTGALPAISGANLTGIAATDNVRTGILDVAGIATFRNDVNIGAAVTISESGIEASGIGITCANINGTQIGGRRNLIINGAMEIAQRGTSSTSDGYHTVDRIQKGEGGTDESVTQSQVDVSSGTTPYTEGFRKAFRLTNGNQTGGADAADYARMFYSVEAQDLAKSGWNYTSSSSFVTLSFWIKSSVAQNFYFIFNSADGTARSYVMETGSLTADTWTKIIKTFPGDSQVAFNNDTGVGCYLYIYAYLGTSYADNSVSVNAWKNVSNPQTPANTTTWWTTNDATLEMTGLQLEVGPQATAFEHRSFNEELLLCQRYYFKETATYYCGLGYGTNASSNCLGVLQQPVVMRATPTATLGSASYWGSGPSGGGQSASYSYVYGSTTGANGPRIAGYELSSEI